MNLCTMFKAKRFERSVGRLPISRFEPDKHTFRRTINEVKLKRVMNIIELKNIYIYY